MTTYDEAWTTARNTVDTAYASTINQLRVELADAVSKICPDPAAHVPVPVPTKKIIGMSAPANVWDQRLAEVGPQGINARRIFADLTSTGWDKAGLIGDTVRAGMVPLISYKVPSIATLINGGYDAWLMALRNHLDVLEVNVMVTFNHEPADNMSGAEFCAGSTRFLLLKSENITVGPIMNGYLLDRQADLFATYTTPSLLNAWDWFGVDSYQSGTQTAPGPLMPARAVPLLVDWLIEQGQPQMPVVVGEYNGFTAEALRIAGETVLAEPTLTVACVWNSEGGKGVPLSGDRLAAFKVTKADARVEQ